jgi:diguanylate cyclase (GGDEF)-like protein/PAS domain S-box-containing protein
MENTHTDKKSKELSPYSKSKAGLLESRIMLGPEGDLSLEKVFNELLEKFGYFSSIVKSSNDAIVSKNLDGIVTSWNSAAEDIFGYSESEMIGKSIIKIIPKDRLYEEMNILSKISAGEKIENYQTKRVHKNGDMIDVSVTISPIVDLTGRIVGASKIARDITHQLAAEQKLWEYANFDSLTKLPNRRLFINRVDQEIIKSTRESSKFALMYMDLDRFKFVNDSLGHSYGDELLVLASNRMSGCFRKSDTLARIGGDEFAALLPNVYNKNDINEISKSIVNELQKPFNLSGKIAKISVSIGISIFPKNGITIDELINYSDSGMYKMKASKKDQPKNS